jgi:Arm DNA-binding domain
VARKVGRLTALSVRRAKQRGYYHDGAGLYLAVDGNGNRSWIFRYGRQGRRHHGLGPLHTVTLAEAREKARNCRRLLLEGIDPIADKRARKAAAQLEAARSITFADAAETYITDHHAAWKNEKNRQQWRNTLSTYAWPSRVHARFAFSLGLSGHRQPAGVRSKTVRLSVLPSEICSIY